MAPVNNFIQPDLNIIKQPKSPAISPIHQHDAVTPNTISSPIVPLSRHGRHEDGSARQDQQGDGAEWEMPPQTTTPLLLLPAIAGARQDDQPPTGSRVKYNASKDTNDSKGSERGSCQRASRMNADPPIWPENVPLPTTTRTDGVGGLGEEQRPVGEKEIFEARWLDSKMLKAVLRLFLTKLQVPVQVSSERASITPLLLDSPLFSLNSILASGDPRSAFPWQASLLPAEMKQITQRFKLKQ